MTVIRNPSGLQGIAPRPPGSAAPTPVAVPSARASATAELVRLAHKTVFDELPPDVVELAKLCLLDWLAVAILGAREPLVEILIAEALDREASGRASLPGRGETLALLDAVMVSGSASHALDYDDGSAAMAGHATVGVASALLPLSESIHATGAATIAAFVAGYEFSARCGALVSPDHYARGFHPTGTVGTLGAAVACSHLLGLSESAMRAAVGIAATQAAGLISSFGTMCKPMHAGRAAAGGLFAARLAARGFTARDDMLEHPYGFAAAHGSVPDTERALAIPPRGFHICDNVFKFHAACGATHAVIEGARLIREGHGVNASSIRDVLLRVNPSLERICHITEPATGLEVKFSMRVMAALSLLGMDTAAPALYTDELARDPVVVALRDKVRVEFAHDRPFSGPELVVCLDDGRRMGETLDGVRAPQTVTQLRDRLSRKFHSLAASVLGTGRAEHLLAQTLNLENLRDAGSLLRGASTAG